MEEVAETYEIYTLLKSIFTSPKSLQEALCELMMKSCKFLDLPYFFFPPQMKWSFVPS